MGLLGVSGVISKVSKCAHIGPGQDEGNILLGDDEELTKTLPQVTVHCSLSKVSLSYRNL